MTKRKSQAVENQGGQQPKIEMKEVLRRMLNTPPDNDRKKKQSTTSEKTKSENQR